MLKKLISLALVLCMVLSFSVAAFATSSGEPDGKNANGNDAYNNYTATQAVYVYKTYTPNNYKAPAQEFTFTFTGLEHFDNEGKKVEGATIPKIDDVTIKFDASDTSKTEKSKALDINVSKYEIGIYNYKVTETTGKTAGITYDTHEYYLVLTILQGKNGKEYVAAYHYKSINGEKKTGNEDDETNGGLFKNTYDSGTLTVTKEIEGNSADPDKEFSFTVTLSAPKGKTVASDQEITVTVAGVEQDGVTWATINNVLTDRKLGDGDSIKIENLPAGVTYTISENADGYDQDVDLSDTTDTEEDGTVSGTIKANDTDTVTYTNTKNNPVDTGVMLDSIPYIALMLIATAGLAVVVSKKRNSEN